MAQSGTLLHVAFVTDGSASHPHHSIVSPKEVADLRQSEARLAMGILGVDWSRVTFLGAPDGALAQLSGEPLERLVDAIAALLLKLVPQAIFLPCQRDGSSEHDAAFLLLCHALGRSGLRPRIFEFPVWSWWNPILLIKSMFGYRKVWSVDLGETRGLKARAAASYVSQTLPIPPDKTSALPPGFASMFLGGEEFLLER